MTKKIFRVLFAAVMVLGGVMHMLNPAFYLPFFDTPILNLLPATAVIYLSGVAEIAAGVATLVPRTAAIGALAILAMMIAFLPLHVLDVFKEHPAIGSHTAALVRLPIQLVLIAWAWFIRLPREGTARSAK